MFKKHNSDVQTSLLKLLYMVYFVDESSIKQRKIVSEYRVKKLLLEEDILDEINDHIKHIDVQNVTLVFTLAKFYDLRYLAKLALRLIDSCFPSVVETENFLNLDFHMLVKILGSSNLNIHSEIEVSNSLIVWLKHNNEKRSKFAEQLLHKVRLTLLSQYEMQHFVNSLSPLGVTKELVETLKEVNGRKVLLKKPSCYRTRRCCDHDQFDVIMCGGYKRNGHEVLRCAYRIECRHNLHKTKRLPSMIAGRCGSIAVYLKGDVYLIGGEDSSGRTTSIHKYSRATGTWSELNFDMIDGRIGTCACSFIDRIFVVGGGSWLGNATNSCCYFNDDGFKEVRAMESARRRSACVVFRGKVVVSGGVSGGVSGRMLKSVESYDVFGDEWSAMPDMIHARSDHSLIVATNKMFVVGDCTIPCEVYDTTFKQFVFFTNDDDFPINKVLCFKRKIYLFPHEDSVFCYDLDEDCLWKYEDIDETYDYRNYCCVKVPSFKRKLSSWCKKVNSQQKN